MAAVILMLAVAAIYAVMTGGAILAEMDPATTARRAPDRVPDEHEEWTV